MLDVNLTPANLRECTFREDIAQHLAVTILGRGVLRAPVHNWRESLGAA